MELLSFEVLPTWKWDILDQGQGTHTIYEYGGISDELGLADDVAELHLPLFLSCNPFGAKAFQVEKEVTAKVKLVDCVFHICRCQGSERALPR
jgi:hypothetical protein